MTIDRLRAHYGSGRLSFGNDLAPQMLFGTPVYASANTEYAFIPNRQLINGVVTGDQSLGKWDFTPLVRMVWKTGRMGMEKMTRGLPI